LVEENHVPYSFPSLSATFTVVSSPRATAYELNALSNSNDWYQVFVTDNWPSCSTGFAFGYEVWDTAGYSVVGPVCNMTAGLSAGDNVLLGLSLNCAAGGPGSACLTFADLTDGNQTLVTLAQPQSGGTAFINLDTPAGIYGYFTGPMTEVVDTRSTTCTRYGGLPTVNYVVEVGGLGVTSFIAWSDEFELTPFQAFGCYSYSSSVLTVENTPIPHYLDATAGSSYGPHWEASQNWSTVSGVPGQWRFQTDVNPLSLSIALSRTSADMGQNITVSGTVTGGAGGFRCEWTVGGIPRGNMTACTWVEVASAPGTATITGYVIDSLSDYAAATATQVVYPDPVVSSIAATPGSVDLGQNTSLSVNVSGGSGGYSYRWNDSSGSCVGALETITCAPTSVGTFDVFVAVTDSNGFSVLSPRLQLTVSPDPTVVLEVNPQTPLANVRWSVSARIQGGLEPYALEWPDLPPGCASAPRGDVSCTTKTGEFRVSVRVTDANNMTVATSAMVRVDPSLLGLPLLLGYGVLSGVTLAAFLGVLVAWVRRRHKMRPSSVARKPSSRSDTTAPVGEVPHAVDPELQHGLGAESEGRDSAPVEVARRRRP
jgi:hypothetical protein